MLPWQLCLQNHHISELFSQEAVKGARIKMWEGHKGEGMRVLVDVHEKMTVNLL